MKYFFIAFLTLFFFYPVTDIYGATETCNNIDDDGDGIIDEGFSKVYIYRIDQDHDGVPVDSCTGVTACETLYCSKSFSITGYKYYKKNDDTEVAFDADELDCNDSAIDIYPNAFEVCDGIDNNCDSVIDDGSSLDAIVYYLDSDGDGYGDPSKQENFCEGLEDEGYVSNSNDCDDTNSSLPTTYYRDADEDGFGSILTTTFTCSLPTGYVTNSDDCNDGNASYSSTATYYQDNDSDTYGNPAVSIISCGPASGYVSDSSDCNDSRGDINPGASEICGNSIDEDCVSGDKTCETSSTDTDGDGDPDSTDCDDTNNSIFTGATETCDTLGIDNDCDGDTDDASNKTNWYENNDGDEYGNPNVSQLSCSKPAGYVSNFDDCDDTNSAINPSTTEDESLCGDSLDNDCIDGDLECETSSSSGSGSSSGGSTSGTDTTGGSGSSGDDTSGSTSSGDTTSGADAAGGDDSSLAQTPSSASGGCSLQM